MDGRNIPKDAPLSIPIMLRIYAEKQAFFAQPPISVEVKDARLAVAPLEWGAPGGERQRKGCGGQAAPNRTAGTMDLAGQRAVGEGC